jgi:chemotaxis protein MotB
MAKKKKKKSGGGDEMPAWLITFSDMMTLLLTFFVLLNSMAVVDERRKLIALGSIIGTFGMGEKSFDVLTTTDTKRSVDPGPMENLDDMARLKELIWDDQTKDVRFAESKFVQVLSVGADLLFAPGSLTLTPQGRTTLDKIAPVLRKLKKPVLLAGHTSTLRDELGEKFSVKEMDAVHDKSWRISLNRVLAVYRYLMDKGVKPEMMRVEAFGRFHPRQPSDTPEGRRMNRRVDIVLDKRSFEADAELRGAVLKPEKRDNEYDYDGFIFRLNGTEQ